MLGCLVVVFMWLHVIFCRHEMNASSLDGLNTDPNQVVEGRTHAGFMTRFIASPIEPPLRRRRGEDTVPNRIVVDTTEWDRAAMFGLQWDDVEWPTTVVIPLGWEFDSIPPLDPLECEQFEKFREWNQGRVHGCSGNQSSLAERLLGAKGNMDIRPTR